MGFSDNHELQIVQAVLFLVTYLVGSAGNVIIITITTLDPQLQSPMYYFLKHLSILDLSSLSVTVPQYVDICLTQSGYISYAQCMLQIFFFTGLAWSEVALLTVMSYDRYVAICLPLHYEVIMSPRKCTWAVAAVWLSGGISGTLFTASTLSIRFCGDKIIHQFFCDVPQLLKLSCSNDLRACYPVCCRWRRVGLGISLPCLCPCTEDKWQGQFLHVHDYSSHLPFLLHAQGQLYCEVQVM